MMPRTFGSYLITVEDEIAAYAETSGVSTIFVDMEVRGKQERQGHLDTHKAAHTLEDIRRLSGVLSRSELMVRINPPWTGTRDEAHAAIDAGASRLMLPMFRTRTEVAALKNAVAERVPVTLLVETPEALVRLPDILQVLTAGDRVHFGLNDLSIAMSLSNLFEVLAGRLLDGPAALCRSMGIPFGVGGVGRIGGGHLPAHLIIGEHVRLGSEWVILSRAFHNEAKSLQELRDTLDLSEELDKLDTTIADFERVDAKALDANHRELAARVAEIIGAKA